MSNVTAKEIIKLTAEAWDLPVSALSEPAFCDGRKDPMKLPRYAARACAVMLIQKHTPLCPTAIARAIGLSHASARERQADLIERFRRHAIRKLELVWRVEAIEQKIDEIHEARTESVGFQRVGCATLAQNLHATA